MSDEPSLPAIPGMPDLGGLMESFQKVQEARSQIYEGRAGGGAVIVRGAGDLSFESVTIRPDVVDPADVEMLQDLVLAALHDLTARMAEAQEQAMGGLGGLDLGGLLGGAGLPSGEED
ncbi:MAG: nucleoid-associated protein EbfC [Thermoleophilaceae bacterium]|nr:nucleoid-associated protein EbfC [Thermoleophilaceae bacterium]